METEIETLQKKAKILQEVREVSIKNDINNILEKTLRCKEKKSVCC